MTYLEEAQARAKRRRSPWNLLLIPAVLVPLVALSWGLIVLLELLHQARYPTQHLTDSSGVGPVLTAVGALLAAVPAAFLIGNGVVCLVWPARRALEGEASSVPGTDFMTAQRRLLRAALIIVPACLAVAVLGAILSW